jgi:translation initiation factor IF-2
MPDVTVRQFADVVGISVDKLVLQLGQAGLDLKGPDDSISDKEKSLLLSYLRKMHGKDKSGSERSEITLNRKTVSELKVAPERSKLRARGSLPGSTKTVSVEVRKKRTYVKRDAVEETELAPVLDLENQKQLSQAQQLEDQKKKDALIIAEAEARLRASEAEARLAKEKKLAEEEEERLLAEKLALEKTVAEVQKVIPTPEDSAKSTEANKAAVKGKSKDKDKKFNDFDKKEKNDPGRKELHVASDKSGRRRKKKPTSRRVAVPTNGKHAFEMPTETLVREIIISEMTTVGALAQQMAVKAGEVIKVMMSMGSLVTINQILDQVTAQLVVEEMGHSAKLSTESVDVGRDLFDEQEDEQDLEKRAPVVTIMGHVDHGKTSLLDYIRNSKVASGEAGGITQHIGAYGVETAQGSITFLDTPGHAAFTSMRARGAKATDIIVLVVAGDDGVKPQTAEAVKHARAANVPMIVAVNKNDKAGFNPDKVKQELANLEVVPDDWGGDTQFVSISAITGDGVDNLLEAISLQAEILELTASKKGAARGLVIESRLDKGKGTVATILVQRGKLERGNILLAGSEYGRVRVMYDANGTQLDSAGPSEAIEVLGLSGTPSAGDEVMVVTDERKAREIASFRDDRNRELKLARQQASKLENIEAEMGGGGKAFVRVVLKADVHGSSQALVDTLKGLSHAEVEVDVVASGVGAISESDVNLAIASGATIFGFNVRADGAAKRLIEKEGIELRYYSIIYELIDDVKAAISGLLSPEVRETIVGIARVMDVFRSSKLGAIAGCLVEEGTVKKSSPIRVLRDSVVIYEGELESLRRFKEDVKEVRSGSECGIGVKDYNDVQADDQIEVFERTEVARTV